MVSRNGLRLYIRLVPLSIQMTALPRERVSSQIMKEDKPSLVRRFITVGHFKTLHVSVLRLLVKKDELSTEVVRI